MADIFISYARDDDTAPPGLPEGKGFVTFLDENIRYEFKEFGPDRPTIWRDIKRLAEGEQFTPEIDVALKSASFLLVILSPNWMARPWCQTELATFAKYRADEGLSARERIILVGKRHIDPDKRPPLLQGQVGYAFYSRSDDADEIGAEHEYFSHGGVQDGRFWTELKNLADYLLKATKRIDRKKRLPAEPTSPASGRTIYLAKPASDMRAGYDRLVKEMSGKGHTVVPDPGLDIPLDYSSGAFIDAALKDAEISVHLLGEKAGPAPEEAPPIVKFQLDRAAAKETAASAANSGFHRIIWAPKTLARGTESQAFASPATDGGERDPLLVLAKFDRQLPTDKIEGDSLSKFVDFLNQHLVAIAPPRIIVRAPCEAADTRIFLHHSPEDTDYALNLAQALQQRQVETVFPAFEGSDAEIKDFNSKKLAECDAVAICWASASEVWARAQASALRDWQRLGRARQFIYRAVVTAPPPGIRKKAGKLLFPRSEIDLIVDLSDKDTPPPERLDELIPSERASAP